MQTLLEHMVVKKYGAALPVTLFRPSIISCSQSGKKGSKYTPPCSLAMLMRSPCGRVWYNTPSRIDLVYVDAVSRLLLDTVAMVFTRKAGPAIITATGASDVVKRDFTKALVYDGKVYGFITNHKMVQVLRFFELLFYRILMGKKVARTMKTVYANFDHFFTSEWDFEPTCKVPPANHLKSLRKWVDGNPIPSRKKQGFNRIRSSIMAFLQLLRFGHHPNFMVVVVGALLFPGADVGYHTFADILKLYFSFNICLYGALYTINGISDAIEDAEHPEKKFRPVPKSIWAPGSPGSISKTTASVMVAILLVAAYMTSYAMWGTQMLPMYTLFIMLNLTYSFGMRNVKYCRFPFAALTSPARLHLGSMLTGGSLPMSVYFVAYFFMAAVQSSKVRIEKRKLKQSINGWSPGTVELVAGTGLAISVAVYGMSNDPLRFIFISIVCFFHFTYNMLPYFNHDIEKTLRMIYTVDCRQ